MMAYKDLEQEYTCAVARERRKIDSFGTRPAKRMEVLHRERVDKVKIDMGTRLSHTRAYSRSCLTVVFVSRPQVGSRILTGKRR